MRNQQQGADIAWYWHLVTRLIHLKRTPGNQMLSKLQTNLLCKSAVSSPQPTSTSNHRALAECKETTWCRGRQCWCGQLLNQAQFYTSHHRSQSPCKNHSAAMKGCGMASDLLNGSMASCSAIVGPTSRTSSFFLG